MSARVDGAQAEAGFFVSSPRLCRSRAASLVERGDSRASRSPWLLFGHPSPTPPLRSQQTARWPLEPRASSRLCSVTLKRKPPSSPAKFVCEVEVVSVHLRMRACAFPWRACASTCAPREGSLKNREDYPGLGVGMGERRESGWPEEVIKLIIIPRFPRVESVRRDSSTCLRSEAARYRPAGHTGTTCGDQYYDRVCANMAHQLLGARH